MAAYLWKGAAFGGIWPRWASEIDSWTEVAQYFGGNYFDMLALRPDVRAALVEQFYALKFVRTRHRQIVKGDGPARPDDADVVDV